MPNKDRPLVDRHAPKNGEGCLVNDQKQLLDVITCGLRISPAMRNLTAITTIAAASVLISLPTHAEQVCRFWGVLITTSKGSMELRKSGVAFFKGENGSSQGTWHLGEKKADFQAVQVTAPWGKTIEFAVDHHNVRCLFD